MFENIIDKPKPKNKVVENKLTATESKNILKAIKQIESSKPTQRQIYVDDIQTRLYSSKLIDDGVFLKIMEKHYMTKDIESVDNIRMRIVALALDSLDIDIINFEPRCVVEYSNNIIIKEHKIGQLVIGSINEMDVKTIIAYPQISIRLQELTNSELLARLRKEVMDPETPSTELVRIQKLMEKLETPEDTKRNSHMHIVFLPPNDMTLDQLERYGKKKQWDEHMDALLTIQSEVWELRDNENIQSNGVL